MERLEHSVAPAVSEVPMLEAEIVRQIRALMALGRGSKAISRELGISRNAAKRYMRGGEAAKQVRPKARRLSAEQGALALELLDGEGGGNAAVVHELLLAKGIGVSLRTLQRTLAPARQERRAAETATVRFETEPGHQMQIDFGERNVLIGGRAMRVMLFVAVLSYSRRVFVRASLSQRRDDWREGLAGAFNHFGGVTQTILIDNAGALVVGREPSTDSARIHPAFAAFCKDWDVAVRVCRPYRARTKGKVESGVGYVKKNAIAGRSFESFAAFESHLASWMTRADARVHGTTRQRPAERFIAHEQAALRALPSRPIPSRQQRVRRKVANDCFVDVATVRYSVPSRLIGRAVEVLVGDDEVIVYDGQDVVARHHRSREPYASVVHPSHHAGLWRVEQEPMRVEALPVVFGRSLTDYAHAIGGVV